MRHATLRCRLVLGALVAFGCGEDAMSGVDAGPVPPDAQLTDGGAPGDMAAPLDASTPPPGCGAELRAELASPEPIFRMSEIPFSEGQLGPFAAITWLPGGYFVVAGDLNHNVGVSGQWLGAGQYVFTATGQHVATQSIAYDARSSVPMGCGEGVYWQADDVEWLDSSTFVRIPTGTDNDGQIFELPPLVYEVSEAGVTHVGTWPLEPLGSNGCQARVGRRSGAATREVLVVVEEVEDVPTRTVLYDAMTQAELGEATTTDCAGATVPAVTPLVGTPTHIIARTHAYTATNPATGEPFTRGCQEAGDLDVYRVAGGTLEHVRTLVHRADVIRDTGSLPLIVEDVSLDVLDPERFAIAWRGRERHEVLVGRTDGDLEAPVSLPTDRLLAEVALAGERLAYILQAGSDHSVTLLSAGVPIPVPEPPADAFRPLLASIELSSADTMLLGQRSQLALYELGCD